MYYIDQKTLIEVSRVKSTDKSRKVEGVYSVGPFPGRVNFAYQQYRAIYLVAALIEDGGLKSGEHVAVVGGGISGVSAAFALHQKGIGVALFEKGAELLHIQQDARHRYVHPNVNFWPEQELNPTTVLPFLNWFAATAQQVSAQISEQALPELKNAGCINLGVNIESFECTDKKIVLRKVDGSAVGGGYDAVILCCGFGPEDTTKSSDQKSYWEPDAIANRDGDLESYLVSGSGDGGIIDVLRQVYRDFKGGKLVADLGHILRRSRVSRENFKLAYKAAHYNTGDASELLKCTELERQCELVLSSLPSEAKRLLETAIAHRLQAGDRAKPVELLSNKKSAFTNRVAPLHLVLLKHALQNGQVKIMIGSLEESEIQLEGSTIPFTERPLRVTRHGPNRDWPTLIEAEDRNELEILQQRLGDGTTAEGPPLTTWATDETKQLKNKQRLAQKFVDTLTDDEDLKFSVTFERDNSFGLTVKRASTEVAIPPIPKKLFGIELKDLGPTITEDVQ